MSTGTAVGALATATAFTTLRPQSPETIIARINQKEKSIMMQKMKLARSSFWLQTPQQPLSEVENDIYKKVQALQEAVQGNKKTDNP